MLRTIGMTRRQARRMVRHESVITALIGAALGLPLGIFLAGLVTQALSQYDIGISIPIQELAAFTLIAILAGLGAAIMPARRASRLDVLDALHDELTVLGLRVTPHPDALEHGVRWYRGKATPSAATDHTGTQHVAPGWESNR